MIDLPDRTKRALGLKVIKVDDGIYLVQSGNDPEQWYNVEVEVGSGSCTCPDYRERDVLCKHIRAAAISDETKQVKEI